MRAGTEAAPAAPGRWRPRFHVTGERNWINDPNGPIQHGGIFHLFYQAHAGRPFWGPPAWGHVTSTDLVTWTRQPPALEPQAGGPDADGCWSGCARIVDGRPAIYYTGVVGADQERVESVCRAWGSPDLLSWERDAANPLIAGAPAQLGSGYHRDPFLWHDDAGWHMLLGSGTTTGDRHGLVLRYDSADATSWTYGGVFFEAPRFGGELDLGEHWECPQLCFPGDAEQAVLILSSQTPAAEQPLMHAVFFVGEVRDGRFEGQLGGRLDHGDVFYAPALCRDESGRDLIWGWAQERLNPERQATLSHAGALTLPRELRLDGDRLVMAPAPELDVLRGEPLAAEAAGGALMAGPQMELAGSFAGMGGTAGWELTGEAGATRALIAADFDASALAVHVDDGTGEPRAFTAPLAAGDRHELRVFADGSLIEVLADDGAASLTTRAYVSGGAWSHAAAVAYDGARTLEAAGWHARADVLVEP